MTMQRHELEAWMGPDWTPEQIDAVEEDYRSWESDNPDASEEDKTAILTAIAQYHDGVLNMPDLARADLDARTAAANARRALKAATIVRHRLACVTESGLAREAGVERMTVRAWLGKR